LFLFTLHYKGSALRSAVRYIVFVKYEILGHYHLSMINELYLTVTDSAYAHLWSYVFHTFGKHISFVLAAQV